MTALMLPGPAAVGGVAGVVAATFREEIVPLCEPVVLSGLAADWPAVAASRRSSRDVTAYLARFDRGGPAEAFVAQPEADGRFFYPGDRKGFDFERRTGLVRDIVGHLLAVEADPAAASDGFHILVNYWWRSVPQEAGSAFVSLVHAITSVGCLPQAQREAWRAMFEHYVFRPEGDPAAHLAPEHRGILAEPTPETRRRVWKFIQRMIGSF